MASMLSVPLELKRLHAEAASDPDRTEERARFFLREADAPATPAAEAWAHLAIAACSLARTDVTPTLDSLAKAIEVFDAAGESEGLLASLVLLVNAWVMVGDRPEARLTAGRALRLARRLGARATEARLLVNLAYTHGEDDDAISYEMLTAQALDIFEALGDRQGMAHCLVNLGGALTRSSQWSDAQRHYDRAERICRQVGSPYVEALLWSGRGGLALAMGDWERALGMYAESNQRLGAQGRDYHRLRQAGLLAAELIRLGQRKAAADQLGSTLEEAEVRGYHGIVARTHELWATIEDVGGNTERAAAHREAARVAEARLPTSLLATGNVSNPAATRVREVLAALRAPAPDA